MAIASPIILKAARVLAGLTREELAKLAGLSVPTLQKIESDNQNASRENIAKVQTALEQAGIEFFGEGPERGEAVGFARRRKPLQSTEPSGEQ